MPRLSYLYSWLLEETDGREGDLHSFDLWREGEDESAMVMVMMSYDLMQTYDCRSPAAMAEDLFVIDAVQGEQETERCENDQECL